MKKIKLILSAAILSCICTITHGQDFEVSPVILNFNALPGNMQQNKITITNHAASRALFKITVEDYSIDENGVQKSEPKNSTNYSCAGWLSVSPSGLEIDPNSQGVINVAMSVPENTRQSRWCRIIISQTGEQTSFSADLNGSKHAGVNIFPQIAVDVFQTPKDFRDNNVKLMNLSELESENCVRKFVVTAENNGDAIVNGKIYILAANIDNLLEYEIGKHNCTIFSGCTRVFKFDIKPDTLPVGIYDISAILDMGPDSPLAGSRLKSTVTVNGQ